MLDVALLAAGTVAIVVAVLWRQLERWSITPPLLGLVCGVLIGPHVAGALVIPSHEAVPVVHLAARLVLAVALMAVGLRYPLVDARRRIGEVSVLLLVVLPAMAGILAAGAVVVLALPVALALVFGTALCPTDPVLASGIVTGEQAERAIPERDRQVLSLESGANDGLALPLVIVAIAIALDRHVPTEIGKAVYEVTAGVVVGAAVGWLGAQAMRLAESHRQFGAAVRSLYTLVVAFLILGLGGLLDVDALLSVFVAGLVHNHVVTGADRKIEVEVDETLNQFLVIPVFVLLGATLPLQDWLALGWSGPLFAVVALALRRLPVMLALRRPLRASRSHVWWLGWFGPIGVAALFYLGHAHEQGLTDPALWAAGTLVITVSTVVHGLTAGPARALYRQVHGAQPTTADNPAS